MVGRRVEFERAAVLAFLIISGCDLGLDREEPAWEQTAMVSEWRLRAQHDGRRYDAAAEMNTPETSEESFEHCISSIACQISMVYGITLN